MNRASIFSSVVAIAFTAMACGGTKSPTAPAPAAPTPTPAPVSTYSLTGSVVAETSSGSVPADGAQIDVAFGDSGHIQAVTTADGRYSVGGVSGGSVTISVSKDGFASQQRQVQISGDMTLNFDLQPNQ
jgi:hypothetical protein